MKQRIKIFVDTDVIISSLLSEKGAAHLLTQHDLLTRYISSIGVTEQKDVVRRLGIEEERHKKLIAVRFKLVLPSASETQQFTSYVTDAQDAHIVQGAVAAKAQFLTTYNIRHYKTDEIKKSYDLIVLTPALLLQFLRNKQK